MRPANPTALYDAAEAVNRARAETEEAVRRLKELVGKTLLHKLPNRTRPVVVEEVDRGRLRLFCRRRPGLPGSWLEVSALEIVTEGEELKHAGNRASEPWE